MAIRRVVQERDRANRERDDADAMMQAALDDTAANLEATGHLELLEASARRVVSYYAGLAEAGQLDAARAVKYSRARRELAQALHRKGDDPAAYDVLAVAPPLIASLGVGDDDGDDEVLVERALVEVALADVDSGRGNVADVRVHAREALRIMDGVLARSPGDAVVHDAHGRALAYRAWVEHVIDDDDGPAQADYEAAIRELRPLGATPGAVRASYELAGLHRSIGHLDDARADLAAATDVARGLPPRVAQLWLAHVAFERSQVELAAHDLGAATRASRDAQVTYNTLLAGDPGNLELEGYVVDADANAAQVALAAKDYDKARTEIASARALAEILRDHEHGSLPRVQRLVSIHRTRGDIEAAAGEPAAARAAYADELAVARVLVAARQDPDELHPLAWALDDVGGAARDAGNRAGARRSYEEELGVAQRLVEIAPGTPAWTSDLADAEVAVASVSDDRSAKLELLRRAVAHRTEVAAERPDDPAYQRDLADARAALAAAESGD